MLLPVLLGAGGGGALASLGRILSGPDLNPGECEKLIVERNELQCRLDKFKVELEIKRVDIDKLKRQLERLKN